MFSATLLVLALVGAPLVPPPASHAVVAVPDEPEAFMLPEAPTYQAVAADTDDDGVREVVRLIGTGTGAISIEAWRLSRADGWQRVGEPIIAVPDPSDEEPGRLNFAGAPARLVVRRIAGIERATLARQPRFDEPGLDVECCLILHDVIAQDGRLSLVEVTDRLPNADAVLALDMDGDGTDELFVTRGQPPLGDTTFPTDARVLRWEGERFAPPVLTELSIGSGVSPFILGDSDGVTGDEAAFIGAQSRLHRVSLRDGDTLVAESADAPILAAVAVPVGAGRGIATLGGLSGLQVRQWPRDVPPGEGLGTRSLGNADLLGVVGAGDGPPLFAIRPDSGPVRLLSMPTLDSVTVLTTSTASRSVASGPLRSFVGWLPGGDPDGDQALFAEGGLLMISGQFASTSALAGVVPIGLVGPDREWLGLWHGARPTPALDPAGGRLDVPTAEVGSGVSLVPWRDVFDPESDGGRLEPALDGAIEDDDGDLFVGDGGLGVSIAAPPGSRVYAQAGDLVEAEVHTVPSAGSARIVVRGPEATEPNPTYRARLAVVTPAGRTYLTSWSVHVLDQAPPLSARTETAIGTPTVVVTGQAAPATEVRIDGRPVTIDSEGSFSVGVDLPPWPTEVVLVATDLVGNESRLAVVGIGWFDFRTLPWIAIMLAGLAAVGAWLYLRAPKAQERPIPAGDDGVLEELDPPGG